MWGLLYSLFVGGAHVIKKTQDVIENKEFKEKYRDDEAGTYFDNKMRLRDQRTDRIVVYEKDIKTGDVWVKDALSCERLRNITQNEVERHYEEERKKFFEGKTARSYVRYGKDNHRNDKCRGVRYKDLKTGRLYVIREIQSYDTLLKKQIYPIGVTFLMDVETGEFVRPIDLSLRLPEEKLKMQYDIIEKEYEKKKKDIERDKNDPFWRDKTFYSNYMCCQYDSNWELSDEYNDFYTKQGRRLI